MRRGTTDTLALIAGLFFVTLAVVWIVNDIVAIPREAIGLIFGGVFILAGAIGLIRAIRRPRSGETETSLAHLGQDRAGGRRRLGRKHMRTLARIGLVGLFAVSAFLAGGAASGAALDLPGTVKAGQRIDVGIRCAATDTAALVHITGGLASMDTRVALRGGAGTASMRVPPMLSGSYDVALTCDPSGLKTSTTVTVTI